MNPLNGALMGAGTAALIGQIVPGTGNPANGIVRAGDGHLEVQLRMAGARRSRRVSAPPTTSQASRRW